MPLSDDLLSRIEREERTHQVGLACDDALCRLRDQGRWLELGCWVRVLAVLAEARTNVEVLWMAMTGSGGPDLLERLADLVEADPELAWSFPQVRKLGRLTSAAEAVRLLRERAAELAGRVHVDVGRRAG